MNVRIPVYIYYKIKTHNLFYSGIKTDSSQCVKMRQSIRVVISKNDMALFQSSLCSVIHTQSSSCVRFKGEPCSSTGMNNSEISVKSFLQHCDIQIKERPTLLFQCAVVFCPKIDSHENTECMLFCSELNKYKNINHLRGGTWWGCKMFGCIWSHFVWLGEVVVWSSQSSAQFRLNLLLKKRPAHLLHSDTEVTQSCWAQRVPTEQLQVQWPASGSCGCGEFTQPESYTTLCAKFNSCSVSLTHSLTFVLKFSERSWARKRLSIDSGQFCEGLILDIDPMWAKKKIKYE